MADVNTTTEWLRPQSVMLIVATFALVVQAVVTIIGIIKFMWKVATKDDIKSLKDDVKSLKADTEHDAESLKAEIKDEMRKFREDLKGVRQDHTNHLRDHSNSSSSKSETPHNEQDQRSLKTIITPQKGVFSADEYDERTRS